MPDIPLLEPPAGGLLLFSPHLDDGVFACGRLLASMRAGATVVTLFAGRPLAGQALTEWDRRAGFTSGEAAVAGRRAEDAEALHGLAATPLWLDFRDSQYGGVAPGALRAVVGRLLGQRFRAVEAVLFPLGLFHADHRLAHAVVLDAALAEGRRGSARAWFIYEDALYRRLPAWRGTTLAALQGWLAGLGWRLRPVRFRERDDAAACKRRAAACYRSQLRALSTPGRPGVDDLDAPECYWRLACRPEDS